MKILDIIVCDDIRQEQGNKITAVGMYEDINLNMEVTPKDSTSAKTIPPIPPVMIPLAILIRVEIENESDREFTKHKFEAFLNGNSILTIEGDMKIGTGKYFRIIYPKSPFNIEKDGRVQFVLSFRKNNGESIELKPEYGPRFTRHIQVKEPMSISS